MPPSQDPLVALRQLYDVSRRLRDRVNYSRRHHLLTRNTSAWNTTCSAMDVVGDTCQALTAYFKHAPVPEGDKASAYLLAYGVLQGLYLQQDAVFWWCKCLDLPSASTFKEPGEWARTIPELDRARNARNDSVGHPVRRDKPRTSPLAAFFIVQHSLSLEGFELHQFNERGVFDFQRVSFPALIADQVRVLSEILDRACRRLDQDDRNHHRKFMLKPLTPILDALSYPLEKLGAIRSYDRPLIPGLVREVERALDKLKAAIVERDEPFGDTWQWEFRKLHRALALIKDYATSNEFGTDDDLADVLADFVRYAIDGLKEMTEELDGRYSSEGAVE